MPTITETAVVLLGEHPGPSQLAGGAAILLSLVVLMRHPPAPIDSGPGPSIGSTRNVEESTAGAARLVELTGGP